jgi:FlaA1/EpsC-like NDP-sugar epimerase
MFWFRVGRLATVTTKPSRWSPPGLSSLRGRYLFLIDFVIIFLAIIGAMVLRFESFRFAEEALIYFPAALLPLVVRPPIDVAAGLYSRAWAYASVGELIRITITVAVGTVVEIFVFYLVLVPLNFPGTVTPLGTFPRSFFILEGMLTLAGFGGARFLIRASTEWRSWRPGDPDRRGGADGTTAPLRVPTLIYGAGDVGVATLRTIAAARDGLGMRVVGLIDDEPSKRNQVIRGQRVLGSITDLEDIARVSGARRLLIAIPTASGDVVRRAVENATTLGLETRTVPALADLVSGRLNAAAIREVEVEDLLRRDTVQIDESGLRGLIGGRCVLVTGAGGSIGSELARQVFDLDPARLVLVDRAEGPLYDIERELDLVASRDSGTVARGSRPRPELSDRLANVASEAAMRRIVDAERPVLVLHAAAYKHVPMMEHHPADAVYTNIGGTLATVRACLAANVERFVLVSTDKAVAPSSVMGATKRLAELAVAEVARASGRPYVAVRFGNVLGSSGSVVPLFQRQLHEGVPLTVTDPEMTRYFMTIPEASRLILEAALIGGAGDLFVLDMGEPVRIVDLARDLARLAGRDPDSVPIQYIGLRPGEKLHESLFYDEESIERTVHPKVLRATNAAAAAASAAPGVDVLAELDALVAIGASGDHEASRAALLRTLGRLGVTDEVAGGATELRAAEG